MTTGGFIVGALVAANGIGQATIGSGPHFWAAPYERGNELGGLGWPSPLPADTLAMRVKGDLPANTTIAIVATDAELTKAQAKRLAVMAHDGMARALRPAHAALDGDLVFAAATARASRPPAIRDLTEIGLCAADCLARAIARAIYEQPRCRLRMRCRRGVMRLPLSGGKPRDFGEVLLQIAIEFPDVARVLHAQPNLGTIAEHFSEAHCNRRRHSLLFRQRYRTEIVGDTERRAISTFVFPVPGMTISRNSSPGCAGFRSGWRRRLLVIAGPLYDVIDLTAASVPGGHLSSRIA